MTVVVVSHTAADRRRMVMAEFLAVGKVSPSRAKIMGIPIEVKETAPVSTYLDACTLLAWKAVLPASWKPLDEKDEEEEDERGEDGEAGRGKECALRVLLTQMISRLDIQRGIL